METQDIETPRIVVVADDDPDTLEMLPETIYSILGDTRVQVIGISDGQKAIDVLKGYFAKNKRITTVITDFDMPVKTGDAVVNAAHALGVRNIAVSSAVDFRRREGEKDLRADFRSKGVLVTGKFTDLRVLEEFLRYRMLFIGKNSEELQALQNIAANALAERPSQSSAYHVHKGVTIHDLTRSGMPDLSLARQDLCAVIVDDSDMTANDVKALTHYAERVGIQHRAIISAQPDRYVDTGDIAALLKRESGGTPEMTSFFIDAATVSGNKRIF